MYKWIDHIVVRVKDIEEGLQDYEGKMGLKRREDPKEIPELGMKRAILPLGDDGGLSKSANRLARALSATRSRNTAKVCTWWRLVLTT